MRAVLFSTGHCEEPNALGQHRPLPMLPIVDRPFIQHVVEYLVERGITEFDFVLTHFPEQIETLLGNGERWGSVFRFHLARDPKRPYRSLKTMDLSSAGETILIGHGDRLPEIPLDATPPLEASTAPVLFCRENEVETEPASTPDWTGWAWLPTARVSEIPTDADEEALLAYLSTAVPSSEKRFTVSPALSVQTYTGILETQRAILSNEFPGLLLSGQEAENGIWLSRNVSLHPTAKLNAPVYIGENCQIGSRVELGPCAVIGRDCALDRRCSVGNALVLPGSFVGEGLELRDTIVDKNRLVNARVGAALSIRDDFILGSLSDNTLQKWFSNVLSRCCGIGLLVVTVPLLLLTMLYLKATRRGPLFYRKEIVRLPALSDPPEWETVPLWSFLPDTLPHDAGSVERRRDYRDLFLRFLPGLLSVAKGNVRFVGLTPRSVEEVAALPSDWRALHLKSKAGLITETFVYSGERPTEDECYSAETFYAVSASPRHDAVLLWAYLQRILGLRWNRLTRNPSSSETT